MSFHPNRFFAIILTVALLLLTLNIDPSTAIIFDEDINIVNADASFIGETALDSSGYSISIAGDVNGDGYDDILISSKANDEGGTDAGQVYLIFGNSSMMLDTDLSNANASFIGESSYNTAGHAVSGVGDVNGDDFDDILISALGNSEGASNAGQTYLIFGKSTGWAMDTDLGSSNASYLGEVWGDKSGISLSGAGDVNNDGYDDFLIGDYWSSSGGGGAGQAYLILGRSSGWSMDTSLANVNASFIGEEANDNAGESVSGAGDVNGDGYDDIIIGAPANDEGGSQGGKAYVIYGKASGWSMDMDLSHANASFIGPSNVQQGRKVAGAGDINGDGYDDMLIGSNWDLGQYGRIYIVFGGANLGENVSLYNVNGSFSGSYYHHFLNNPARAGDLNGDGYDDFIMSSMSGTGTSIGKVFVIYGRNSGWTMNASLSTADASFDGEGQTEQLGYSLSGGGDVNNDGYPDLLMSTIANDDGGNSAGKTYLVLFEPNTSPSLTTTDDTTAIEDELYSVQYLAIDAHTSAENLTWNWTSEADWLTFNTTSRYLNGTPDNDDVGSYWVNITVTDEHDGVGWTNFTLTVNNVNDVPEILTTDVLVIDEDELYSVQYDGFDIDPTNDVFTWSLNTDADWLSIDNASRYLNGTPDNYDVGSYWVNVTLSDNQGGYDWSNFTLTVNNVNDAPELTGEDLLFIDEDEKYMVRYDVIDIDPTNDQISWTVSMDAWFLTPETYMGYLILNGTPINRDVGLYSINVSVDDGNGGFDWTEFDLQVNNTNDAPKIQNDDVHTTKEDELYSVHYSALDIDPTLDILMWEFDTDADWLSLDPVSHYLNGTPENDDVGFHWVYVSVEDGLGGMDWSNFTLEVENVNDAPQIQTEGIGTCDEDSLYSVLFEAVDTDPTMDVMIWYLVTEADWLSIDPLTGYLNGTPGNDDVGTFWVNVSVSDGNDGVDWRNFTIVVLNVNDAPLIITDPVQTTDEDVHFSIEFNGTDIDPTMDKFTWDFDTNAEWLFLNWETGELFGTPTNDDVGQFWVNITLDDRNDGFDWLNFTLEVVNVNDAPEISTVDPTVGEEDHFHFLKYEALDIDPTNDVMSWNLNTNADWLSMDLITGYLNGTPTNDDVGIYWVNITVEDGNGGSDWTNFTLEILNHNDAPSILTIDVTTAIEDELYSVMYGAVDIDPTEDIMTWSLDTDASWLSFDHETNYLSGTPTNDDVGTYYVNMTLSDGNGGSAWTNFIIAVENTNDLPEWTENIEDMEIEGEITSIQVTVSDIDPEDEIVYSISTDPVSSLVIDPETGTITWEDPTTGTYLVNVSASDGSETIYQEFTVEFPEKSESKGLPWIPIVIVIVVLLLLLLLIFFLMSRKKKEEEPEETPQTTEE